MLLGSVNHVSITVSNLREAMKFYGPLLEFMGFQVSETAHKESAQTNLIINANPNDTYMNDGLEIEFVHMPPLERTFREQGLL